MDAFSEPAAFIAEDRFASEAGQACRFPLEVLPFAQRLHQSPQMFGLLRWVLALIINARFSRPFVVPVLILPHFSRSALRGLRSLGFPARIVQGIACF